MPLCLIYSAQLSSKSRLERPLSGSHVSPAAKIRNQIQEMSSERSVQDFLSRSASIGRLARRPSTVAALALTLFLIMPFGPSRGDVFPGTGTGSIPDGGPGCGAKSATPRDITFNVSGLTGPVGDVDVAIDLTHSWVGDVDVELIAPNGDRHTLFARTGLTTATGCGDSSDLGAGYIFDDNASLDWWSEAAIRGGTGILSPGEYRTTTSGGTGAGGLQTEIYPAFSGLPPLLANGAWTLRVHDWAGGDTGAVAAASLGINEDCTSLSLGGILASGQEDWASCGDLTLTGISVVFGPSGDLTLTSGSAVVIAGELEVRAGATFTAGNSSDLVPLLVALSESRRAGAAARPEEAAGADDPSAEVFPNEDKLREIGRGP